MFLLVVGQFVIYFPVGYLLLNYRIKSLHYVEQFSLCVSFGLIIDMILVSIIGILYVGYEVLLSVTAVSYALIVLPKIVRVIRNLQIKTIYRGDDEDHDKNFVIKQIFHLLHTIKIKMRTSHGIVQILVVFLVIGHFSLVGEYMGWPPGLDAINSGLLTSLINYNHKLGSNLSPLSNDPWFEPFGFSIMSSYSSLLFKIFPGEAVLVVATTIMILIFLLIYTAAYRLTGSLSFAVLALISGFYIYPITSDVRFLEKWLIGYYYNTPYPNLLGYLTLLQFIILKFIVPSKDHQAKIRSNITTGAALTGIALAYTPFIILPAIYILGSFAKRFIFCFISRLKKVRVNNINLYRAIGEKRNRYLVISLLILTIVIYAILVSGVSIINIEKFGLLFQRIGANSYYYSGVVLNLGIFTNLTGIWTIITSVIATLSLIKRNRVNLTIFYLIMSIPILVTATYQNLVGDITWFLFPGRLFAFLLIFDWIMLVTYANDFLNMSLKKVSKEFPTSLVRSSIAISLIISFFLPSFLSQLTLEQADKWDWNFGRDVFKNDYALFAWLSKNTNSSDLIMIDYSYDSRSIHSFSLKNLTHNLFPSTAADIERDKDNLMVWERPSLLKSFVDRYDVKYILVDSEPFHTVPPEVGGDNIHTHKLFTVDEYNKIFRHMPFLEPIKHFGSSSLYKVINGNQSLQK